MRLSTWSNQNEFCLTFRPKEYSPNQEVFVFLGNSKKHITLAGLCAASTRQLNNQIHTKNGK